MRRSETSLNDILGEEFGPYKLVRRLGVGGMAETFVAVRRGPSGFTQRVCLKLVLPFFRENQDFISLFEREARLAAKLRHRNIVGVIDFGEIEGTSYMALELVDGLDLRNILDAQPDEKLPHELIALFGLELAEALEHAHHPPPGTGIEGTDDEVSGIVHRDISPSNVLVSRQGEILLSDFGVAKAMTGNSRKQSAVKGKVPYMSPEQLRAEPLDGRADLFALGVVLFEALSGGRPYEGAHDPATIMLILKGEHTSLAELAPDAPPGLCNVIERLLKPDRDDRPATAAALIEELEDFAPSPRVRRQLGRLVTGLRDEAAAQETSSTEGPVSNKTEVLPEVAASGTGSQPKSHAPSEDFGDAGAEPTSDSLPDPTPSTPPDQPWFSSPGTAPLREPKTPSPGHAAPHGTDPVHLVRPPRQDRPVAEPGSGSLGLPRRPSGYSAPDSRTSRPAPAESSSSRRKIGLLALGALLTVGAVTGGIVAFWPSDASPKDSKEEPASPTAVEGSIDAVVEGDVEDGAADTEPAPDPIEPVEARPPEQAVETNSTKPAAKPRPKPAQKKPAAATGPGRLTITVFPWGSIWIDGNPWGPAPLRNEVLPSGKYRIGVGQSGPTETRTIRLKPGQRKTVRFDLTD